jgi:polyisoprenoid-binding protein YceI
MIRLSTQTVRGPIGPYEAESEHTMSTTTAAQRLSGNWTLNPTHSSAEFAVKYLVAKFRGSFGELDARLADGVLTGAAKADSISVKDQNLVGHLRSPEFFDAERHPEITFRSNDIDVEGDRVELDGELTIKGNTRPIHATGTIQGPTEDFMGNTKVGLALETTIDRTEFGLTWNADLPKGGKALSNEVTLSVELEFVRA